MFFFYLINHSSAGSTISRLKHRVFLDLTFFQRHLLLSFLPHIRKLLERAVFTHGCRVLTWVSLFNYSQSCFHSQHASVTAPTKVNMTPVSFNPTDPWSPHPGCTLSSI